VPGGSAEKLLDDACIMLSVVASDSFGTAAAITIAEIGLDMSRFPMQRYREPRRCWCGH
jgi:hypothetical protein